MGRTKHGCGGRKLWPMLRLYGKRLKLGRQTSHGGKRPLPNVGPMSSPLPVGLRSDELAW